MLASWSMLCATLVAVAVVARRGRRHDDPSQDPIRVARVAERLRDELEARHPNVAWRGFVAGASRSAVLCIDGQETVVSLARLTRLLEAFPDHLPRLVERMVDEVRSDGLATVAGQPYSEVATAILPQLRTAAWVAARGGRFGGSALVWTPFAADLVVCYVVDEEQAMTFVCREHLKSWGTPVGSIHHLAIANLRRWTGSRDPFGDSDSRSLLMQVGDGYDAARLLLCDAARFEGRVVALPDRDALWIGDSESEARAALEAGGAHPISASLYRVEAGRLVKASA